MLSQWIGVDDWFTEPPAPGATGEPEKQGLKVSKNTQGKIEIALSKWFRQQISSIFKDVAKEISCPLKLRRQAPDVGVCRQRQITRVAQRLGQNERLMQELRQGSQQLVRVGGINTAELAAQGNVAAVANVEVIRDILAVMGLEVNSDTVIMGGLGAIVLGAFFYALDSDAPYKAEVPDPKTVPKAKFQQPSQETSTCPKDSEDWPDCDHPLCVGSNESKLKCTKDGEFKDCDCWPSATIISRIGLDEMFEIEKIIMEFDLRSQGSTVPIDPTLSCSKNKPAGLPWKIFAGSEHSVTGQFCQEVEKSRKTKLSWIVDVEGNKQSNKPLMRRVPPVKPDTYKDYMVQLEWSPKDGSLGCTKTCTDAYKWIAMGECGNYGRQRNEMVMEGSWMDGCGTYAWTIIPPKPVPKKETRSKTKGPLKCYAESDFPGHKKVSQGDKGLKEAVDWACDRLNELQEIRPGQKWDNSAHKGGKSPYKLSVEWPENCVVGGLAEQRLSPTAPLMDWHPFYLTGNLAWCKYSVWLNVPNDSLNNIQRGFA
ncbi:uncharacterized protein ColSpa_08667 [Colletotrichum spaethianum]|uniref:Uncharacterized protein n=1 Tax=Colletotrichum spaethianum TaxID=700344 RepID=A0AA37PA52_9PEZI|nr:uncharacterized protein ColSpa_08667 [Colletotrichum spaethianum]GKT48486.1 hypothetical protein ColSpa_08667 [Colletotrichum spaethianum]